MTGKKSGSVRGIEENAGLPFWPQENDIGEGTVSWMQS